MDLLSRNEDFTGEQSRKKWMVVIEEQATPYAMPSILVVHESGDRLTVELEYDDRVFSDGFMETLARGFTNLLHQMSIPAPTMKVQSLLDCVQKFEDGK